VIATALFGWVLVAALMAIVWRLQRSRGNAGVWWAYLCLSAGSALWWVPLAGIVAMYVFLTRVTGIPPTEAQALRSRGEAYRRYQRTTNAFFPWAPRRER